MSIGSTSRLLILGAGPVIADLYAPALRALKWGNRVTVVDTTATALERAASALPGASLLQRTWEEALDCDKANFTAAIVALPNRLHASATQRSISAGLHVLCEKPLTLKLDEVSQLKEQANRNGRLLAVGMVRRLIPAFQALRHFMSQEVIGHIRSIEIQDGDPYSWTTESREPFEPANGGVLADIGIHYLDLVHVLLGQVQPIDYQDDNQGGVEANCVVELVASNEIRVRLRLSRTRRLANTFTVVGEKGELIMTKGKFDACILRKDGRDAELRLSSPFVSGNWDPTLFESCFAEQLFNFEQAIRQDQHKSIVTAAEAAEGVRLLEWCYQKRNRPPAVRRSHNRSERMRERIIVTGGTGFIGRHLVQHLSDAGAFDIRVLLRSFRSSASIARHSIDLLKCDLLDRAAVDEVVNGTRKVFHLAYGKEGAGAADFTVHSTRNVVEAAIKSGAESVVVLSTAWVFGLSPTDSKIDESAPYNPYGGSYARSKVRMERWCLERAQNCQTRIVVLNPTCVFGPYGWTYTMLPFELASAGRFCWIEHGSGLANVVYIENLIDAMLLAADNAEARGQRFIINDETLPWRSFLEAIIPPGDYPSQTPAELLEAEKSRRVPRLSILAALRSEQLRSVLARTRIGGLLKRGINTLGPGIAASLLPTLPKHSSLDSNQNESGLPPAWIADLYGPNRATFSSEKARKVLGWSPKVNMPAALDCTVRWLRKETLF